MWNILNIYYASLLFECFQRTFLYLGVLKSQVIFQNLEHVSRIAISSKELNVSKKEGPALNFGIFYQLGLIKYLEGKVEGRSFWTRYWTIR